MIKAKEMLLVKKLKRFTLIIGFFPSYVFAQCSGGTAAGALSPVPGATFQTMAVSSGNYYTFVVPAGCMPTYDFSFCAADGASASFDSQITILNSTGAYAGGYSDDFCGTQSRVTWTPTVSGTYRVLINTFSCSTGSSGTLAYRATIPPNMTYTSSTVAQASTATVTTCDTDQEIISVQITTSGSCSPLALTQFSLGAGSSTSATLNDVSKIHIYYTGTSSVFATTNEFVAGGTTVTGGTHTITGSQALVSGVNYFWVAYDIKSTATIGNVVDASCSSMLIAGISRTPSTTNPAGTRTINACPAYPVTSALGLKHWVKSDVGITLTGGNVSAWADQSGAGLTGNLTQGTAANRPSVAAGLVNFQDYIRFDGSNDILASVNTFSGNTLFSTAGNTIFMIKNYKSGLVDYKWETDPTNSYRIGMELMGTGAQRIDFVDDNAGGKNDLSTTAITNRDVMVEYVSDASAITLKLNGNTDAVKTHALTFNPPAGTLKPLYIGANDLANPLYCNVDIAEVLTFNKKLSASEFKRVESYLAIKYGITLGNNKGTGASVLYMSSDATAIWDAHTAFHNYVIGIGRDNAAGTSGLNKLKSTSVSSLNGSTDILTIANGTSLTAPSAFAATKSFFIVGSNALTLASTASSLLDLPAGIVRRLERVWVSQETGTVGNVRMQFNMSTVPGVGGVAGANDLANVRLLVDANGVFASGTTIVSPSAFNNTTDLVEFQFDFTSATGFYFTIGSVDAPSAPLPVELLTFNAYCKNNVVELNWLTASENNNNYFTIQKSADNTAFETLGTVVAFNLPSGGAYSFTDAQPYEGYTYYKLSQTDYDGQTEELGIQALRCEPELTAITYNPIDNSLTITAEKDGHFLLHVVDATGKIIFSSGVSFAQGKNTIALANRLSDGLYIVTGINANAQRVTTKFVVQQN